MYPVYTSLDNPFVVDDENIEKNLVYSGPICEDGTISYWIIIINGYLEYALKTIVMGSLLTTDHIR